MKQLGTAISLYVHDYDERFFPSFVPIPVGGGQAWWFVLVEPYVKAGAVSQGDRSKRLSVFVCPDIDSPTPDLAYSKGGPNAGANRALNSYGPNANLVGDAGATPIVPPAPISRVGTPASLILLMPHNGLHNSLVNRDDTDVRPYATTATGPTRSYLNARGRHGGGANFLMADGHAKWFKAPSPWDAPSQSGVCWQSPKRSGPASDPNRYRNCSAWCTGAED